MKDAISRDTREALRKHAAVCPSSRHSESAAVTDSLCNQTDCPAPDDSTSEQQPRRRVSRLFGEHGATQKEAGGEPSYLVVMTGWSLQTEERQETV